jgi:hypothetical protein
MQYIFSNYIVASAADIQDAAQRVVDVSYRNIGVRKDNKQFPFSPLSSLWEEEKSQHKVLDLIQNIIIINKEPQSVR